MGIHRVLGLFTCVMIVIESLDSVKTDETGPSPFRSALFNRDKKGFSEKRSPSSDSLANLRELLSLLYNKRKGKNVPTDGKGPTELHKGAGLQKTLESDVIRMVDHHGRNAFREADKENPLTSQTAEDLLEEDTHDIHPRPVQPARGGGSSRRSFLRGEHLLWTKGTIPYVINGNVGEECRKEILASVELFHNNTCIHWEPYLGGGGDHVEFFTGGMSSSYVGNIQVSKYGHLYKPKLSSQPISIDSRHCTLHVVLHEMSHTVGMTHEQSRSDRDRYVTVHWEHVLGGEGNQNLAKEDTENHDVPYDYSSLMHYSAFAFSKDKEKTLEYKNTDYEFLGLRENILSFYDIEDITKAYKCAHACNETECRNAGYMDMTCSCRCPDYLQGPTCEEVVTGGCGGVIELEGPTDQLTISSPGYPQPYPAGGNCVWLVKAPRGYSLELTSQEFSLPDNSLNRCSHWLEVRAMLIGQPGPLYCGDSLPVITTKSGPESHLLLLRFDSSNQFVDTGKGFNLTVKTKIDFSQSTDSTDSPLSDDAINHCELDPNWCYNGGTCVFNKGEVSCSCLDGFSGDFCEHSEHLKEMSETPDKEFPDKGIYSCDPSTACQIRPTSAEYTWTVKEQGLVVTPQSRGAQAGFTVPFRITESRDMCLEFTLRRRDPDRPCGELKVMKHVTGADFGYGGYQYDLPLYTGGCEGTARVHSATISPFVGESITVSFTATVAEDGDFNMVIENISITEGIC